MANSPLVGGFNSLFNSSTLSLSLVFLRNMLTIGDHHPKIWLNIRHFRQPTTQLPGDIQSPKVQATTVGRTLSSHGFFWHGLKIGSISFTTQSLFSLKKNVLGFIHFYTLFSDTSGSLFIDQILFDGQITIFQNFRWLGHVQLLFVQKKLIF